MSCARMVRSAVDGWSKQTAQRRDHDETALRSQLVLRTSIVRLVEGLHAYYLRGAHEVRRPHLTTIGKNLAEFWATSGGDLGRSRLTSPLGNRRSSSTTISLLTTDRVERTTGQLPPEHFCAARRGAA